jgi:hypothetical protein
MNFHFRFLENRNDPDLVQAFLKKWWVKSDFKAPNLPLFFVIFSRFATQVVSLLLLLFLDRITYAKRSALENIEATFAIVLQWTFWYNERHLRRTETYFYLCL